MRPRSSGDRARASGARCAGSNPAGGTERAARATGRIVPGTRVPHESCRGHFQETLARPCVLSGRTTQPARLPAPSWGPVLSEHPSYLAPRFKKGWLWSFELTDFDQVPVGISHVG